MQSLCQTIGMPLATRSPPSLCSQPIPHLSLPRNLCRNSQSLPPFTIPPNLTESLTIPTIQAPTHLVQYDRSVLDQ